MTFSDALAAWLAERGMRQSQLAAYIGVARSTVSAWVTGRSIPRPEQCAALARVLHLPLEQVMALAGYPTGQPPDSQPATVASRLLGLLPMLDMLDQEELEVVRHTALGLLELREARARYGAEQPAESQTPAAPGQPGRRRPRRPGRQSPPSS